MSSLQQTLSSLVRDGDDYLFEAPEDWAQGRTLYGGISAALLYTAVRGAHDDLGPLRSAQFAFVGPATGSLRFTSSVLRRGRSSAVVSAESVSEAGIASRALFVFGGARDSTVRHDHIVRMDVPPPDRCEPFHKSAKPLPGFLGRFEMRLGAGARLFEPEKQPEFAVWTRLRDGDGDDPVAALLAYGDALPCAAMANFAKPAPVSTMTWSIDFHLPAADHAGWHLVYSSSESAEDGYSLQNMRVFSEAGEPLASARQVVAIFA